MRSFTQVEDETTPSVGAEVGKALAPAVTAMSDAVTRIGEQNAAMQQMLSKSITDALQAVDSKQIIVENQKIKQWDFKFERDSNLLLKRVVAIAK